MRNLACWTLIALLSWGCGDDDGGGSAGMDGSADGGMAGAAGGSATGGSGGGGSGGTTGGSGGSGGTNGGTGGATGGSGGAGAGDDSCAFAMDGECDEPVVCEAGTDTTDCDNAGPESCPFAMDGECDEPDICHTGTDTTDCGGSAGGGRYDACSSDTDCNGSLYCESDLGHCTSTCVDDLDCELNDGESCNQVAGYCRINCGNAGTNGECPNDLDCDPNASAVWVCITP